jgi:hypothetical protein
MVIILWKEIKVPVKKRESRQVKGTSLGTDADLTQTTQAAGYLGPMVALILLRDQDGEHTYRLASK